MTTERLFVNLRVRWWVIPYVRLIWLFSIITGLDPDDEKVANFITRHGFRVTVMGKRDAVKE